MCVGSFNLKFFTILMNSMLNWLVILPIITIKHLLVSFTGIMNAIFRFLFGNDFIGLVTFVKTQCRSNVDLTVNRVSLSYVYWCHLIRSTFGFICFCSSLFSMILLALIIASMHFSSFSGLYISCGLNREWGPYMNYG